MKKRLLTDDVIAYVEQEFRAAIAELTAGTDAAEIEAEIAAIDAKIEKFVGAIETVGISDTLAERLRKLKHDRRQAEQRLAEARTDHEGIEELPDLVPALMGHWRRLVANIEGLADNPHTTPDDIETARDHLQALLGKVTLEPRDGVLWAFPSLNAEGLAEASPLHIKMVAGA